MKRLNYKLNPTAFGFDSIENFPQLKKFIDIFSEQQFVKILPKSRIVVNYLLLEIGQQGTLDVDDRITIKRGAFDNGEFIKPVLVYHGNVSDEDFFSHLITQF